MTSGASVDARFKASDSERLRTSAPASCGERTRIEIAHASPNDNFDTQIHTKSSKPCEWNRRRGRRPAPSNAAAGGAEGPRRVIQPMAPLRGEGLPEKSSG